MVTVKAVHNADKGVIHTADDSRSGHSHYFFFVLGQKVTVISSFLSFFSFF